MPTCLPAAVPRDRPPDGSSTVATSATGCHLLSMCVRAWRARRRTASGTPAPRSSPPGRATRPRARRRLPARPGRRRWSVTCSSSGWTAPRPGSRGKQACCSATPTIPATPRFEPFSPACPPPAGNGGERGTGGEHGMKGESATKKQSDHQQQVDGCNRRRGRRVPVNIARKPWWQQATALVTVSASG